MKLRVELDLTPQELTELTQNHQALWQNLQMQFWSQVSQQMMKMSPLGGFYPMPGPNNDERGGPRE
ncbi:Uncharacterised protein [Plesiomonas shigelloides]|uniref:hypothetical protein n=1 Tax=Plesiomonas shigelloides TaxID=703 RepID=UPI000DFF6AF9|nr:hypothetical protein [Plesiomonas shigelloides]MDT1010259.1 hypothetical protein [Plesiomonas shigelloides]SUB64605.1 Uncharacterised protein [Plesiomonas shigelloides]